MKMPDHQQNSKFNSYTNLQKDILDLEKKYFDILYQIFSQPNFQNELKNIMININNNWSTIQSVWKKTNIVDLAVERHINFRIFNDSLLKGVIKSIYPSVISSDTAFVTDDAVINIDSKTINVATNKNDWSRQTVGCNQMSFDNKLNFEADRKKIKVQITSLLEPFHNKKPVLSFFLSTLYYSDHKNQRESWYTDSNHRIKPYHGKKARDKTIIKKDFLQNIKFTCMPHHELSNLFNNCIVSGVKAYDPPDVPNPTGTHSIRVDHESLRDRYDSAGNNWEGFKSWTI